MLRLHADEGAWNPGDTYWGDRGEPLQDWASAVIARGPRRSFEMEQVLPGADPEDFDTDPIIEACERNARGDAAGARTLRMDLLAADLRCLDAHAHLCNLAFATRTEDALRSAHPTQWTACRSSSR